MTRRELSTAPIGDLSAAGSVLVHGKSEHEPRTTEVFSATEGFEIVECDTTAFLPLAVDDSPSAKGLRRRSATSIFRSSKDSRDTVSRKDGSSKSSTKKRSRGFSFTKRASKTLDSPVPPVPHLPSDLLRSTARTGATLDALLKDLTPQKMAEYLRHLQRRSGSPLGCAEYDPDLVLDAMSFARISDFAGSTVTTADCLISPEAIDVPVHAVDMDNLGGDVTLGSSTGFTREDEIDEVERDREDREEERGFLRALGLEFDITRAVEEC